MKLKSVLNKLLTNKWVLNIVFVASLLSVISYLLSGNIDAESDVNSQDPIKILENFYVYF